MNCQLYKHSKCPYNFAMEIREGRGRGGPKFVYTEMAEGWNRAKTECLGMYHGSSDFATAVILVYVVLKSSLISY